MSNTLKNFIICPKLDLEKTRQYYDKLRVFATYYIADNAETSVDIELKKIPFEEIETQPFMWDSLPLVHGNNLEMQTNNGGLADIPSTCNTIELYGLHNYSGFYGFFRPLLDEVIGLISTVVSTEQLQNNVKEIWVTTEPAEHGKFPECFDQVHNKHRGITLCHIVPL